MTPIILSAVLGLQLMTSSATNPSSQLPPNLLAATNPSTTSQLQKVWYKLDNGSEIAVLPIVSLLSPSLQRVSIVTCWTAGAHHDPATSPGRTKLAAHMIPLIKNGDRPARSYNEWQAFHGNQAEIRAGNRHTWIVESVAPAQLQEALSEVIGRFHQLEVLDKDVESAKNWFHLRNSRNRNPGNEQLTGEILDRLDPLQSGPRIHQNLVQIETDEVRRFISETFLPANTHIAIVGPFDPRPVLQMLEQQLATIPQGKKLPAAPAAVPDPGHISSVMAKNPRQGVATRGWRVPLPGTNDALALGLFIPRIKRVLQSSQGQCIWNPFKNPDVLLLSQQVAPGTPPLPSTIEEALFRIDASFDFSITAPVEGKDLVAVTNSIGVLLGAHRVGDEVSMRNPLPVAEVLLLRKVFDMKTADLRNNFGRKSQVQLQNLREKYLDPTKSVSGSIAPAGISDGKSSIQVNPRR
ncbi:MAG: insulinase family protein [Planctomycetota bacterium]